MSNVSNLSVENHGVKIWTYPDGHLGVSIFFPYRDELDYINTANFVQKLIESLQEGGYKVITEKVDAEPEPKKDMKISISNANKDNAKHVTVEGYDRNAVVAAYNEALDETWTNEEKKDKASGHGDWR